MTDLRSNNGTADTALATDLAGGDGDAQVAEDVDGDLNLGASLDTLDGGLGKRGANLPELLALLLVLLLAVKVGVVLVIAVLLGLGLGLRLGDLDVGAALDDLDQDVATVLGGGNVDGAAGGNSSLGLHDGREGLAVGAGGDNTNGVGNVLDGGDSGVGGLLNVSSLVLLDEGGLEGGTAGLELRRVEGGGAGGGGEDGGGLGEDVGHVVGDAGSVGGTAAHDDLVDVEDVELGLLDGALNQAVETLKDLAGDHLVSDAVDGGREVEAVGQGLDGELGVGAERQGLLGGLGLETQLGERAGVAAGVDLVLLHELLGEVVHQGVVEVDTGKVVVVNGGEDGVHAAARGDDADVGAGAAQVGDDNDLVADDGLLAGIVGEDGGDGVRDELEDLEAGGVGGLDKSLALLLGEVCGDGDDGRGDSLAEIVGGGGGEAAQVADGGLVNGDGGGLDLGILVGGLLVLDSEGDVAGDILGVGGGVAVRGIDRLEALREVSIYVSSWCCS